MLTKTLLNKVDRFKSFVYGAVSIKPVGDEDALVIDLVARRNSRPVCPDCGKVGPMGEALGSGSTFGHLTLKAFTLSCLNS